MLKKTNRTIKLISYVNLEILFTSYYHNIDLPLSATYKKTFHVKVQEVYREYMIDLCLLMIR